MKQTGTKQTGYYPVVNSTLKLPVMTVSGATSGPTLLVTAGIHGGEYPGIEACRQLFHELDAEKISGQVIILPCVNTLAFEERCAFIHPEDKKNLNRCFPGDAEGSISEKIAATVFQDFIQQADFYLDFHSGDLPEQLDNFVFMPTVGNPAVIAQATSAAQYLKLPFGVKSNTTNGAYGSSTAFGVPALLIERGGNGQRRPKDISGFVEDALGIMSFLEILPDKKYQRRPLPIKEHMHYIEAFTSGLWQPYFSVGATVKKGELLGQIEDIFGQILWQSHAEQSGEIIYQWQALSIKAGDPLIAYGS